MKRSSVSSSMIKSVGFEEGFLEVEFSSGKVVRYSDVPESVWDRFLKAPSLGGFFHKHIKDRFDTA